jgi:hypothetical protein
MILHIPPLLIPPTIHFDGVEWLAKREFHVTMLNTESEELLGRRAISAAKKGLHFEVALRDEHWMLTKGRARSIIRVCDVAGADEFFARLGIEKPPLHVTLYTIGDRRGIGIATHDELDRIGARIRSPLILRLRSG